MGFSLNDVSDIEHPFYSTSFANNPPRMATLTKLFSNLTITKQLLRAPVLGAVSLQTNRNFNFVYKPIPGKGHKQFRRVVHFPEDGKYTIKPLDNTHLAGRDPVTGRKVVQGLGGGVKHK